MGQGQNWLGQGKIITRNIRFQVALYWLSRVLVLVLNEMALALDWVFFEYEYEYRSG
jgi:hypothetical protein